MAVLLVSHDFGVVAQLCDRVVVMYGGRTVERGPVEQLYDPPAHPYTKACSSRCRPCCRRAPGSAGERREGIPGQPPEPGETRSGCVFAPRCDYAQPRCETEPVSLEPSPTPAGGSWTPTRPGETGAQPGSAVTVAWTSSPP